MDGPLEVINGILMAFPSENNGLRQKDSCKIRVTGFRSNTSVPESQGMADLPLFILEHRHACVYYHLTFRDRIGGSFDNSPNCMGSRAAVPTTFAKNPGSEREHLELLPAFDDCFSLRWTGICSIAGRQIPRRPQRQTNR
ncbi:hypothetical protein E6O75_ATG04110 [Venturia nashicola]|uniref:Uncharacterized protein n=1 Tax=Venturia nashicola TaxID=86259 RepID=A0A4Z1P8T1_9PEZI|nr:hypothetical protein E6O75_ATG04110 [Venturia nashicola]